MNESMTLQKTGFHMDLKKPWQMYLKAVLFFCIGMLSLALLFLISQDWRVIGFACLSIWAFSRLYYFCFYVIEKYIDPSFKFSGLVSVIQYLLSRSKK